MLTWFDLARLVFFVSAEQLVLGFFLTGRIWDLAPLRSAEAGMGLGSLGPGMKVDRIHGNIVGLRRWAGEVQLQLQSKCGYAKENVSEHQKVSSANLLRCHPSVMAVKSLVKRRSAGRWVGNHKGVDWV